jgi:deazaflavin-dependent oxidoreductase (nitroreductase family)
MDMAERAKKRKTKKTSGAKAGGAKARSTKRTATAKKATSAKKAAPAKRAAPAKKAVPAKKAPSAKKKQAAGTRRQPKAMKVAAVTATVAAIAVTAAAGALKRARSSSKPARSGEAKGSAAPKLPGWIADHLERYEATNGADGHIWRGVPTLLLTTVGSRSGEPRRLPLIYGRDGERYLVVASRGGAPDHPAWYKNLVANPDVEVQVGADRFRARARPANRDERPRLWRAMTRIWPAYDQYQSRTQREIPVVLIERR